MLKKLTQRWLHLLVSVTVVTSLGFLVYGLLENWGAAQWGSYGQCVGSAVTFAAVVVALREAFRADRARLVDHELSRRREAINALSELWAGMDRISAPLLTYSGFLEFLPHTFDPEVPLGDHELEGKTSDDERAGRAIQLRSIEFMNQWGSEIGTPLFRALTLMKGTSLDQPLHELNKQISAINIAMVQASGVAVGGRRPSVEAAQQGWLKVVGQRSHFVNLARERLALDPSEIEQHLRHQKAPHPNGVQG